MSTRGSLPAGQFTTQINGKQCTAVPKSSAQSSSVVKTSNAETAATTSSTSATEVTAQTSLGSSSLLPAVIQIANPNTSQTSFSTSTTTASAAAPLKTTSQVISTSTPKPIPEPNLSTAEPTSTPEPTPTSEPVPSTSNSIPASANVTAGADELPISETPSLPSSSTTISATPDSRVTTPTRSSQTPIPIVQSAISSSLISTPTSSVQTALPTILASQTISSTSAITGPAHESSAAPEISSNPKLEAAPVVGGVLGSIALISIMAALFWLCRRRRRRRDSFLTPLTTGRGEKTFYEKGRGSVGLTKRSEKWWREVGYQVGRISNMAATIRSGLSDFGSTLKTKVIGERSDTPSVNLNRGNSQFLDGPVPQHSRNNSLLSNPAHLTVRDRFNDSWDRFTDKISFSWRLRRQPREPADPFAEARKMTEKQADLNGQPDFSQLLGADDRQLQASMPRDSSPDLGSLGIDFEPQDPFADPVVPAPSQAPNKAWVPLNPFTDPITEPQRFIPKSQNYISESRRSRGQYVGATDPKTSAYAANNAAYRPPSAAMTSLYRSSSRNSYRDTVFSAFSSNARKGKGRSDPFDLERPELWRPIAETPPVPDSNRISTRPRGNSMAARKSAGLYPDPRQPTAFKPNATRMSSLRGLAVGQVDSNGAQPRVVSMAKPRVISNGSSRYSSDVSSLGDWGDPGPDLGPGSSNASLRGDASSGDLSFGGADARGMYGGGEGEIQGSSAAVSGSEGREWDSGRVRDNMSPISLESRTSSKGGVGKAM